MHSFLKRGLLFVLSLMAVFNIGISQVWAIDAALLPNGKQQFIDANGVPYAGGFVYTYVPNTTTPKTTWVDPAKGSLNTNPIVLDSAGEALIYGNGAYRQILKDSLSNTVWDQPTQAPLQPLNNLSDVANPATALINLGLGSTSVVTFTSPFTVLGTSSAGASVVLGEQTTNGTNTVSIKSPDNITSNYVLLLPNGGADTLVGAASAQTLTNKTITSPLGDFARVSEFRLTLTSGVPVTTTDVTAATTLYVTPYKGNEMALYNGSAWRLLSSSELTIPLSGLTSGKPYDIFAHIVSNAIAIDTPLVWTNDSTRATALIKQDGVYVKSGDPTDRYLGTIYTTGTGTTEDSNANRYVYNYYNAVPRSMTVSDATATWSYNTATYRQANANTANQLNFMQGVSESSVSAWVNGRSSDSTANNRAALGGIGLNSTTTPSGMTYSVNLSGNAVIISGSAMGYAGIPPVGRNFLAWLEQGPGSGTITWYGGTINGVNGICYQ